MHAHFWPVCCFLDFFVICIGVFRSHRSNVYFSAILASAAAELAILLEQVEVKKKKLHFWVYIMTAK